MSQNIAISSKRACRMQLQTNSFFRKSYWKRILYRKPWKQIAKELDLYHIKKDGTVNLNRPDERKAKWYAEEYAKANNYPIPLVRVRSKSQDIYIKRQNGWTWQKISKEYGISMTKCKLYASQFAQRYNYKYPPKIKGKY